MTNQIVEITRKHAKRKCGNNNNNSNNRNNIITIIVIK